VDFGFGFGFGLRERGCVDWATVVLVEATRFGAAALDDGLGFGIMVTGDTLGFFVSMASSHSLESLSCCSTNLRFVAVALTDRPRLL
jgi:hypothetical protein